VKEGYAFESETDTEAVAKLLKHIYDLHKENSLTFSDLVAQVIQPLVCQPDFLLIYMAFIDKYEPSVP